MFILLVYFCPFKNVLVVFSSLIYNRLIADALDGNDSEIRVIAEALSQSVDVHIDGGVNAVGVHAPDFVHKLNAGENLVG